ncbi:MAG: universal stress protein, partial [Bacteroidota bacterium]
MSLFKKILYPTDFSESSIETMACALELAKSNQAELTIFYVDRLNSRTNNPTLYVSLEQKMREKADKALAELTKKIPGMSRNDYQLDIGIGDLYERISNKVETSNIDLVVINKELQMQIESTYQIRRVMMFSELSCPVLILPSYQP